MEQLLNSKRSSLLASLVTQIMSLKLTLLVAGAVLGLALGPAGKAVSAARTVSNVTRSARQGLRRRFGKET
jgi:hypothetical protein